MRELEFNEIQSVSGGHPIIAIAIYLGVRAIVRTAVKAAVAGAVAGAVKSQL